MNNNFEIPKNLISNLFKVLTSRSTTSVVSGQRNNEARSSRAVFFLDGKGHCCNCFKFYPDSDSYRNFRANK